MEIAVEVTRVEEEDIGYTEEGIRGADALRLVHVTWLLATNCL